MSIEVIDYAFKDMHINNVDQSCNILSLSDLRTKKNKEEQRIKLFTDAVSELVTSKVTCTGIKLPNIKIYDHDWFSSKMTCRGIELPKVEIQLKAD